MSGISQQQVGAPQRTGETVATATVVARSGASRGVRPHQRPTRRMRTAKIQNKPLKTVGEFDDDETFGWRSGEDAGASSENAPGKGVVVSFVPRSGSRRATSPTNACEAIEPDAIELEVEGTGAAASADAASASVPVLVTRVTNPAKAPELVEVVSAPEAPSNPAVPGSPAGEARPRRSRPTRRTRESVRNASHGLTIPEENDEPDGREGRARASRCELDPVPVAPSIAPLADADQAPVDEPGPARGHRGEARQKNPHRPLPNPIDIASGIAHGLVSLKDWLLGHPRFGLALGVIALVLVALYGPAQSYYVAVRRGEILQAKYDQIDSENTTLSNDVARLQTEEGIKEEAAKRGYVDPDDIAVDEDADAKNSTSKESASKGSTTAVEASQPSMGSVVDDPKTDPSAPKHYQDSRDWKTTLLDDVFLFDPEATWNE